MGRMLRARRLVLGAVTLMMGVTATVASATPDWATYGLGSLYLVPVVLTAVVFEPAIAVVIGVIAAGLSTVLVATGPEPPALRVIVLSLLFRGIGFAGVGLVISLYARSLRRLAYCDPLTGLPNRRAFFDRMSEWSAIGRSFAVVACDVDGLKAINDCAGHAAGDAAIKRIAIDFATALGAEAFVARVGGDEFLALTTRPPEPNLAVPGASIGIATHSHGDLDITVAHADSNLYRAKQRRQVAPPPANREAA